MRPEHITDEPALLAAADIDYGRTVHTAEHPEQFLVFTLGATHYVGEIRAIETHLDDIRLGKEQLVLYVPDHIPGGSGSESQHRHIRQQAPHFGYLEVRRAEIISPLRYAMSLIDRYHRHFHRPQFGAEYVGSKPLGGYI